MQGLIWDFFFDMFLQYGFVFNGYFYVCKSLFLLIYYENVIYVMYVYI